MVAEDLAGVGVGDCDGGLVREDEGGLAGVLDADAEVMEFARAAQGEFAEPVDAIAPDAVVGGSRRSARVLLASERWGRCSL